MRDLAILIVFAAGLAYAFRTPFVGLMVYMWISIMNPHRYAWGFATEIHWNKRGLRWTTASRRSNSGSTTDVAPLTLTAFQ